MADQTDQPLAGYYLAHRHHPDLAPLRSIMDMPREEALLIVTAFAGKSVEAGDEDAVRIAKYYDRRLTVESWLRDAAMAQGVVMRARHPLYFKLANTAMINNTAGHLALPVEDVDLSCCSFTIGDSFCNHRYVESRGADFYTITPHDFMGQVMPLRDTALALAGLEALGSRRDDYIEVQMWDRLKL